MTLFTGVTYAWPLVLANLSTLLLHPDATPTGRTTEYVGVAIVRNGQAVVLATPGLAVDGRLWRFRSLDTSDLPQPIRHATLSASGTKLHLQPADAAAIVIDLTQQHEHNMPLQYVDPRFAGDDRSVRRHAHTLPAQRFASIEVGRARLVSDEGTPIGRYAGAAVVAAWSHDGSLLLARTDGTLALCGPQDPAGSCTELSYRAEEEVLAIAARAHPSSAPSDAPVFLVLSGTD